MKLKIYFSFLWMIVFCFSAHADRPPMPQFLSLHYKPPPVQQRVLSNGTTLYFLVDKELPLVNVSAMVRVGSRYEPANKIGLASLCGTMIRAGGTTHKKTEELDEELEFMSASVESGIDLEAGNVSLNVLKKDLPRGLEIFADVLMYPAFDAQKLEIEKNKVIEGIRRRNDDPFQIARREFRKSIYGENHPLSRFPSIAATQSISRNDLQKFYSEYFCANNTLIAVSGDFDPDDLVRQLEPLLKSWQKHPVTFPAVETVPLSKTEKRCVGLVDKTLPQTSILMGSLGIKRHNPDHFALEVLNEILGGGGFSSRLYKEVRTRQGLAYWVGSSFAEYWDNGSIAAGCQTKNATTNDAIASILKEIERARTELVSEKELTGAKNSIVNSFVFRYASSAAILGETVNLIYYGYPQDYLETYTKKIETVSAQEVLNAAQKYLKPDQFSIIVVGTDPKNPVHLETWGSVKKLDITIK